MALPAVIASLALPAISWIPQLARTHALSTAPLWIPPQTFAVHVNCHA